MGIDRTGPLGPFRFAGSQAEHAREAARRPQSEQTPLREDSINLSSAARDLARADATEREDLVRRIRSQVQSGAYHVDAEAVARGMLKRGDA